jgi:GR25 family glycosyltransferase involved in LPS biosynthesis
MTRPRVGISAFFQFSVFSNGYTSIVFTLADTLEKLGYIPVLINTNGTNEWYDDCPGLKNKYEIVHLADWKETAPKLDLFIDIDGYIVPSQRRRLANRIAVFIRKPVFIHEAEKTVYPVNGPVRDIRDCELIMMWEELGEQDAHLMELLSEKPVVRLPYTWSESLVENYGASLPQWNSSAPDHPWEVHIMESNQSVVSNSTLPIVAMAYVKTHSSAPVRDVWIHNAQNIEKEKFFQENVFAHSQRPGLEFHMIGRQRITDWRAQSKSCCLTHIRFQVVKTSLLDAAWNGIPLIHSSPYLRDMGCGLDTLYYPDNSITAINQVFDKMNEDLLAQRGFFAPGNLDVIRSTMKARFDPIPHQAMWRMAIVGDSIQERPSASHEKRILRVGFSDMWQDANCEYNFWTLLLENAVKHMSSPLEIKGIPITDENINEPIDLLFFAPFGSTWTRVHSSVPKIHITGENSHAIIREDVKLNFGFDATNTDKGIHRFPLWIQYLDWFGADQERLRNPRTMPVEHVAFPSVDEKRKFCAFVVTNPSNSVRNSSFQWLSQYKPVDSAGRLFNNVGDILFVGNAGGGGGELKKFEFLKDYKFCIAFENSKSDGYVTEKFIAAKAAGCVPIYWGAEDVGQDFAEGSFINANGITCADDLINLVRTVDTDNSAWRAMAEKPSVDIQRVRGMLGSAARSILELVLPLERLSGLPVQLGCSPIKPFVTPFQEKAVEYLERPSENLTVKQGTLLVTFATQSFLGSLKHWILAVEPRRKQDPTLSARVYLGADVETLSINILRSEHPWIDFRRVPSATPPSFTDLWEPHHYAWKLWIYQELVRDKSLDGTLIWYMDAGSIIVRWPEQWFDVAKQTGLCMLEDSEQKNKWWCNQTFCKELGVTAIEGESQQVVGGIMAFVGGAVLPWTVFTEAWRLGQRREIIVGDKWAGIGADGHPFGHRHDQSILSLLRLRMNVPVYPLERVYNHESLRRTFKSGAALYVHRGQIKENADFAPRIGEAHIVSLARRSDRIKRFKENHEAWTKDVFLRPAFDGKNLTLTKGLTQLFAPNDFGWKKPVMGCALSHLSIWADLASELPACENYLVLEDDVKFKPGWLERWPEFAKHIPDDYDILYLGGVLPPNRAVFDKVLEPVNEHWSRIAYNSMFGQKNPTRYFHFCNYAYIISRTAAQKILQGLQTHGGYHTSADHMICNRTEDLNMYIITPMEAGCYQDDDPIYQKSSFNDFSRVDSFDSDLWNNTDRFSEDEIKAIGATINPGEAFSLADVLREASSATLLSTPEKDTISSIAPVNNPLSVVYEGTIFTVGEHKWVTTTQSEHFWLRDVLGPVMDTIQNIPHDHEPLDSCPIFIICRPHIAEYWSVLQRYEASGKPFKLIHISDEFCSDPLDFYSYTSCKGVLRNYPREECTSMKHVSIIPLGPWRRPSSGLNLDAKSLLWSFYGTKWMNREASLDAIKDVGPNSYAFYDNWLDPKQIDAEKYSAICAQSFSIPCPRGQNAESFRLWEALEFGCLPLIVRDTDNTLFYNMLREKLHIPIFSSWIEVRQMFSHFVEGKLDLQNIRKLVLENWAKWKSELKGAGVQFISS